MPVVRLADRNDIDADAAADASTVCVRCSARYRAYLLRLAAAERLTVSALVDRSIEHYARSVRFDPPPQR